MVIAIFALNGHGLSLYFNGHMKLKAIVADNEDGIIEFMVAGRNVGIGVEADDDFLRLAADRQNGMGFHA